MMDIDAFILVGGRSSRFGSDKTSVEIDGKPVLKRTVETIATALDPKRITLVAADEAQPLSAGSKMSLPFIFDIYRGCGPFGALHAALSDAQTEWAFTIACDYPLISLDLIIRLASNISDDIDAVAPIQPNGRVQPLIAFYRAKAVLNMVEDGLSKSPSNPGLWTIFDKVPSKLVPFKTFKDLPNAEDLFLNMNTPADLQRAIEIAAANPPRTDGFHATI